MPDTPDTTYSYIQSNWTETARSKAGLGIQREYHTEEDRLISVLDGDFCQIDPPLPSDPHLFRTRDVLVALGVPAPQITTRLRENFVRHLRKLETHYGARIYHNSASQGGIGRVDITPLLASPEFDALRSLLPHAD